ncbi:MAG: recombinase RecA [Leptospiraceae bacterium]|nr:recombinase RecA [Leptospiraceae bacterium]MDW7977088.1 recombinase RecA [Leptospiraceae bacterium]
MAKKKVKLEKIENDTLQSQEGEYTISAEKKKAVEGAIQQIERQFGKGAIMKLGSSATQQIDVIPTGALTLDIALGVGGYPRGRIIEIFGPESSGKTTLCLSAVAETQKMGGVAAFVDAEHALDPNYAKKIGVNIDELLVAQPDYGEEALEITEALVRSNAIDLIIVDSVAALVPKAELEGNMGDTQIGLQARLMSQAMRKLTGTISKSKAVVIFVNQIRNRIGVMFGSPETTTGGNALKFYASVRLDIRKLETLKKGEEAYGSRVRVKVVKNKVAPPFKQAEFDILFQKGIHQVGCIFDAALSYEIIERSGTWFSYGDLRLGQGKENCYQFLEEHPEIRKEIEQKIKEKLISENQVSPTPEVENNQNKDITYDPETGEIQDEFGT